MAVNDRRLEFTLGDLLDRQLDNLLHVGAATATIPSYSGRSNDFTRRMGAISDETANLSIRDSAALAYKHWKAS